MADNQKASDIVGSSGPNFALALADFSGDPCLHAPRGILSGSEGAWTFSIIVGGAGTVGAGVQRVTLASNDPAVVSLASIDTKLPALGQALAAASVPVVLTAAQITTLTPPAAITGFATAANQSTEITALQAIQTAAEILDNAISGSEMQVDIVAALPAGTNGIGKLTANSGVDIGDVDVTSVPTDPFGTNADAASATGSISAKLRFIAATGIPITGTVTVGSHAVTNAGTFVVQIDGTALTRLTDIETNTDSLAVVGNGAAATAQRVSIANDSTGILAGVTTVTTVTTVSTVTNLSQMGGAAIAMGTGTRSSGTQRVTIATDDLVPVGPATSGGCSLHTFKSDASAKAGVMKASAGQLYSISIGNVNAAVCYLRLYNQTGNPTTSDTPVGRYMIPGSTTGAGREIQFPLGAGFSTGIAYRITTGVADNDDTAAASNEVTMTAAYK
jgi:hypothetical protein